ncbi:hypothetical protein TNCV_5094621 [Trichonephila clavipes]|nr:hypothetical protein TNCV_5094621 [Trichonephila clavipes]
MQQFKTGLSNSRVKRICKRGAEGLVTFDTVDGVRTGVIRSETSRYRLNENSDDFLRNDSACQPLGSANLLNAVRQWRSLLSSGTLRVYETKGRGFRPPDMRHLIGNLNTGIKNHNPRAPTVAPSTHHKSNQKSSDPLDAAT